MLAAFAVGFGVALAVGLGGGSEPEPGPAPAPAEEPAAALAPPATNGDGGSRGRKQRGEAATEPEPAHGEHECVEEGPSGPPPESSDERAVAAAVRSHVRALSRRDARAVCAAFVPGALRGVRFPRERGSCERTVAVSLGYRDPRGLPVWRTSRLAGEISAQVDGERARVVATVLTRYADDREPSVEDDIVYLERRAGRWLLSQPSATLYRAIGVAEIPAAALMPAK